MIEAVLFDGDQTLWDFQKVMRSALVAVLAELRQARPGPLTERLTVSDLSADRNEVAIEFAATEWNLARLRTLGFARTLQRLRAGGDSSSDAENAILAERLSTSYFRHRDQDPALFDDTLPCLETLRGNYRLGLLSNGSRMPETVGLGGFFEVVVFAQDHRVAKPDRGIFAVVERQMNVTSEQCTLVGDHPLNDVVGAKRSHWRAVWIDREGDGTYTAPEGCTEVPDAVVTSLDQLPEALVAFPPGPTRRRTSG